MIFYHPETRSEVPRVGAQPWAFRKRVPCPGMYMRRTHDGISVVSLHYSADPTLTAERLEEIGKGATQAWWDLEMEMHAEAMSGALVYPDFSRSIHVVTPDEIPKRLCRFMSIDPHLRTPHSMLWVGLDSEEDWWVYREMWPSVVYAQPRNQTDADKQPMYTIKQYADNIAELEGNVIRWHDVGTVEEWGEYIEKSSGEKIITRFMDQAGKGWNATAENESPESYAARYARFGITCIDPNKKHTVGQDAIRELMLCRPHGTRGMWPRIHISSDCLELIYELENYRYKTTPNHRTDQQELKQAGTQVRCHGIDNLRYLATGNLFWDRELASDLTLN